MTTPVLPATCRPRFEAPDRRRRFGLLVLATDLTSERDFNALLPRERVATYATRVAFENPTTPANLVRMGPRLGAAATLLAEVGPLDAVCYSCTSASVLIGDTAVAAAIGEALPGVPVVTPSAAARLAFAALGVRRIAVLTPYLVETSRPMAHYFAHHGFEILRFECLGLEDDRLMARVLPEDIVAAALAVDRPEAEAIFLACTGLPALGVVGEVESRLGKPVISSNQASLWAMARVAGLDWRPTDHGRLFGLDLPDALA